MSRLKRRESLKRQREIAPCAHIHKPLPNCTCSGPAGARHDDDCPFVVAFYARGRDDERDSCEGVDLDLLWEKTEELEQAMRTIKDQLTCPDGVDYCRSHHRGHGSYRVALMALLQFSGEL